MRKLAIQMTLIIFVIACTFGFILPFLISNDVMPLPIIIIGVSFFLFFGLYFILLAVDKLYRFVSKELDIH